MDRENGASEKESNQGKFLYFVGIVAVVISTVATAGVEITHILPYHENVNDARNGDRPLHMHQLLVKHARR